MRLRDVLLCVAILFVVISCKTEATKDMQLIGWGDSMMSGAGGKKSILEIISNELNELEYTNYGVGGLKSQSIAVLQGGLPLKLKFDKEKVSPWSSVTSTYFNSEPYNNQTKQERKGSIGSVKCTLTRNSDSDNPKQAISFTLKINNRLASIPLQDTIVFKFDDSQHKENAITIIWAGRNDNKTDNELYKTRDNIKAMIDYLSPDARKRLLVLSVCNGIGDKEYKGSNAHTRIGNLNRLLKASFKDYFVDLRSYMVEEAIYDMEIIPTSQDIKDIKNDCIPRSFLSDHVHFNTLGYEAAGKYLGQVIKDKKWIN